MTPEERAAKLGDVIESGADSMVEVCRGEIADVIRAAVAEEREACLKEIEKCRDEIYDPIRAIEYAIEAIRERGAP